MYSIWEITNKWQRRHHSVWQISYLQNCKWQMIYLISQITFIFLTQIYYNMNFITSSSISSQDFLVTLRSVFADCFWRTFFGAQKCILLKELGILLKSRETFEEFLAACNSPKNTGLPKKFFISLLQLDFKNINFQTKTKRCLLCWLLWIQN